MSNIIRAIVLTNSSDDDFNRVKIKSEGIWKESDLIESIGGISLKKDDVVYVDVSEGYNRPLILGRSFDETSKFSTDIDGTLLFESSDGSNWTIGFVKHNKLTIVNSDDVQIVVDGSNISIKTDNATIEASKVKIKADEFNVNDGNLSVV